MHLLQDLKFALRTFAKAPLFVGVALLSLVFGIGANTAIFSLTDQVLVRMPPVTHREQFVIFSAVGRHYGNNVHKSFNFVATLWDLIDPRARIPFCEYKN